MSLAQNEGHRTMITATYEFEHGYARLMNRGITLWNGSRDDISADNPMKSVYGLVYEVIGAEDVWSDGYNLKGIKVTIEIEESAKQ